MAAARPARGIERGGAASATTVLAARAWQHIGPVAGPARAGTLAATRLESALAIAFPVFLPTARGARSAAGKPGVRALPVRTDSPPPPPSRLHRGGHNLSGSGMLDHMG